MDRRVFLINPTLVAMRTYILVMYEHIFTCGIFVAMPQLNVTARLLRRKNHHQPFPVHLRQVINPFAALQRYTDLSRVNHRVTFAFSLHACCPLRRADTEKTNRWIFSSIWPAKTARMPGRQ